jgi:hypothetical protein
MSFFLRQARKEHKVKRKKEGLEMIREHDHLLSALELRERAGLIWPMSEHLLMEAAMVLWEAFLDAEAAEVLTSDSHPLNDVRDRVGTITTRQSLMPLIYPLHIGWHVYEVAIRPSPERSDLVPFDLRFTPWFLRNCCVVDPDAPAVITLRTGWLEQCRAIGGIQ